MIQHSTFEAGGNLHIGDNTTNHKGQSYAFEVGGNNKKKSQITNLSNAYLVKDDMETGFGNQIPLWLFGFLY